MKNITAVLLRLCLVSAYTVFCASAFAQVENTLPDNVSGASLQVAEEAVGFQSDNSHLSIIPMTVKVTHLFDQKNFEDITLEDIKASAIFGGVSTSTVNKFIVGVNGEVLSYHNQMFYTPIGQGRFQKIEVMGAEVIGMYKVNEEIFLQIRIAGNVGLQIGNSGAMSATETEKQEFMSVANCANCVSEESWSNQDKNRFAPMSGEVEFKASVKNFELVLLTRRSNMGVEFWQQLPTTPPVSTNSIGMTNLISQSEHTIKLNYTMGNVVHNTDISLYLAYSIFNTEQNLYYRTFLQSRNPDGGYAAPAETMNQYQQNMSRFGMLQGGISISIGRDRKSPNKALQSLQGYY